MTKVEIETGTTAADATAEDLMAEAAKAAVAECLDTQTCEARHKRHAALSASA